VDHFGGPPILLGQEVRLGRRIVPGHSLRHGWSIVVAALGLQLASGRWHCQGNF
jgi:hypothetical protein